MKRLLIVIAFAMVLPLFLASGCRSTGTYSRVKCICEKRSSCICKGTSRRADCDCPKRLNCRCGTKLEKKDQPKENAAK